MVSMLFRDPRTQSSTLAALRTLQPRAFKSLNHVETSDLASNYYLEPPCNVCVTRVSSRGSEGWGP